MEAISSGSSHSLKDEEEENPFDHLPKNDDTPEKTVTSPKPQPEYITPTNGKTIWTEIEQA